MAAIAELAGVFKITVSRALNGSTLVWPEVRERIVEVARNAGYRLNVAARNLPRGAAGRSRSWLRN